MEFSSPLYPVVVLLTSGVIGMTLSRILSLSPIVGFFILGAAIGPHGLALINGHAESLHFLGELGVCFLLFDVGLHLSLKELRASWKNFVLTGVLQFVVVTALLGVCLNLYGLNFEASLVIASIFSLSSTALVLKMLTEHHEESSPVGKKATEILIFQDVAGIILLVFLAGARHDTAITVKDFLYPLGKMVAAAVVMVVIGRIALKPLFRILIAIKNDEVFTSFALLIVFFASWTTESLGLSLALGAFLGGLALSESSFSYIVRTEISPFRGLLLALFFLTVGMSLNLGAIVDNAGQVVGLLAAFYFLKALGNWLALVLSGMERASATRLAFLLSQGSEFAFVLVAAAQVSGLFPPAVGDLAISTVGLSLALTPLLGGLGCALSRSQCSIKDEDEDEASKFADDEHEVLIVEFDDFARDIAGVLSAAGISYRGHDRDMERLTYAKSRGFNVFYSDLSRPRTLGRVSTGKVLAVVCLLEDDSLLKELLPRLKTMAPDLPIIAASSDLARIELLGELGVEHAFIKSKESLSQLVEVLLNKISIPAAQVKQIVDRSQMRAVVDGAFPRPNAEAAMPIFMQ